MRILSAYMHFYYCFFIRLRLLIVDTDEHATAQRRWDMTKRNQITKNEARLDQWTVEALNEFLRAGILRTPTAQECRDAYDLGESPQTWAAHIAGFDRVSA